MRGHKKTKKILVIGFIEERSNVRVFQPVFNESQKQTFDVFHNVLNIPKTFLLTDYGTAFAGSKEKLGLIGHRQVNHSGQYNPKTQKYSHFVNPDDGTHTNTIESSFGTFKVNYKPQGQILRSSELFTGHLGFWLFKSNNCDNNASSSFVNICYMLNQVYTYNEDKNSLEVLKEFDFGYPKEAYKIQKIIKREKLAQTAYDVHYAKYQQMKMDYETCSEVLYESFYGILHDDHNFDSDNEEKQSSKKRKRTIKSFEDTFGDCEN